MVSSEVVAKLTMVANRVRNVIERMPRAALPHGLRSFPAGACGDAAQLLAAFLADCGLPDFLYVVGSRDSAGDCTWSSHAWIERGGVVVDITADQFLDAPAAVIVSADSAWHRGFVSESLGPADFRRWHGSGVDELGRVYHRLKLALPPAPETD
jgi:hypothetical protein